ncbi:MAG: LysR family transcriptional regulator [Alphaproteobacteria bacterium]
MRSRKISPARHDVKKTRRAGGRGASEPDVATPVRLTGRADIRELRNHLRLRTLEAFRHVYDTGSVTRAAERLGVSQPAVSQAIFALEKAVGFPLFDRSGTKRLTPTAEGRELYPACCRVLEATATVERIAGSLEAGHGRRVIVGVVPEMSVGFAQDVMDRLMGQFPEAEVGLDARYAWLHEELLVKGDIDISLSTMPAVGERIDSRPLMTLPAMVGMPAGHPLADRPKISPRDLVHEPLAVPRRPASLRTRLDAAFAEAGLILSPSIEAPVFTLGDFVLRRNAVALFGPIAGWHHRDRGVLLRPLDPPLDCTYHLLVRKGGVETPYVAAFAEEVVALGRKVAAEIGVPLVLPGSGGARRAGRRRGAD